MQDIRNLDNFSDECFGDFLKLIHHLTGITIANNRKAMVQGRIRKRIMTLLLDSYESYLALVKSESQEQVVFIDLITTNETYFFRTPRIWDYLEKVYLPNWYKSHPKQVFLVWSAAASSGEEAHSLGVTLQAFKDKNSDFVFQILGTDISKEMVTLCQKGIYGGRSIESFKNSRPEWFSKYMTKSEEGLYQVNPEIKARIRFQQHNLFKPLLSQDRFDLVLLRNVLIYFTATDQEKVLHTLFPRLADQGLLIIGESESLSHIQNSFKHVEPLIYTKSTGEAALIKAAS